MSSELSDLLCATKFLYSDVIPAPHHAASLAGFMFLGLGALAAVGAGPGCGTVWGMFVGFLVVALEYSTTNRSNNLFTLVVREKLPFFDKLSEDLALRGAVYSILGALFCGLGGLSLIPAILILINGVYLLVSNLNHGYSTWFGSN